MPLYEYYCKKCSAKFEMLRPMSRSDEPATCPEGHAGALRTLSVFAAIGRAGDAPYDTPSSGYSEPLRFERVYHIVRSGDGWRAALEGRVPKDVRGER